MKTVYEGRPEKSEARSRLRETYPDLDHEEDFWRLYDQTKQFSLLQAIGFYNIYCSIRYIAQRKIPGDIVECGVFLGGASIFAALTRDLFGLHEKKVYLFDTFCGFPEGTSDFIKAKGKVVHGGPMDNFLEDVKDNIRHCDVRPGSYEIVAGPVEQTLLTCPLPEQIALLRMDTDFYVSTKAQFEALYPRLAQRGVLIIDDYGTWDGVRKASDEALAHEPLMLHRISHSIRSGIKI